MAPKTAGRFYWNVPAKLSETLGHSDGEAADGYIAVSAEPRNLWAADSLFQAWSGLVSDPAWTKV